MKCHLFWCNVLWSTGLDFCGTDKSSTVRCLSKWCYQCVSQPLIRELWAYLYAFSKKSPLQRRKSFMCPFLPLVVNKKIKLNSQHTWHLNTLNTWHLHTIQKSGLLKALESHFSLVWGMKNGIIYPCLGNGKVFTDNFNLINLLTFNFCMKTVRKLNVLGVYTISKTFLSFHTTLLKCFI